MDGQAFDRLVAQAARRPSRRAALSVLSAGFLAVLLPVRVARADHSDVDGDQLWDEDEADVYGTNPEVFDTDGDGIGDGEEIWNRDQGLGGSTNPLVNENAAPPAAPPADPAPPPPAAACTAVGGACGSNTCCQPDPDYTKVQCCFDANGAGVCTDVFASGLFRCPDPGVPTAGCPGGQIDCGGFCTDVMVDHGNCGFCGNACSHLGPSYNCVAGTCTTCSPGLTSCGGICVDLSSDSHNCGACGRDCGMSEAPNPIAGEKLPIVPILCMGGQCALPF